MYVYVVHVRDNGLSGALGAFSGWEKAEEEADNHAASKYKISRLHNTSEMGEKVRIRVYAIRDAPVINYVITRFTVDEEIPRPVSPFPQ